MIIRGDGSGGESKPASIWLTISAFIIPLVLGGAGIYCVVQGKWINDSATLFYAGLALVVIALGAVCAFCVYFAYHKSKTTSAAGGGCCGLMDCLGSANKNNSAGDGDGPYNNDGDGAGGA